ncbi:hypothetical protein ABB37_09568 [Leptomonas pyrrhocoris]|uniref:Transmembrane protein n=1 Tax=Leptomonas pyrrhocoris TaxID=157538 RepID=A0A0N0DRE0_LEPPY|nr:hypothetical protein ABB37_09568 [Leptomonas pyrrhocoris]XP_015652442.1 hypothetical protein ABB37_09568 [Leptomonas pyrrhocoris]XP_015652443.1 hypothetical protein ABB37_09568 [Leptomonas pyrrhocoris]KPA74002.1 hypothetical protein ABB37_09568 [Leptomonas pyrrhocoris]KPA74003.1 hypothetical protein ABB37_09568 [Leptomonas pyrrhocoris]KPA74004.1 hypothetical protein ABB37_09568 [Leptomonas pyrrhocoris]|eukprot:XP_015652441.1 hypothetical protein ABB37_09568 [Leptomonas pyrrhocoris]
MLRCCGRRMAKPKVAPRRSTIHAVSSEKKGKDRFDLFNALQKDRQRIERNRTLPWKERLGQLRVYPWKMFIVFMVLWSWLGTYAVPYLKGMKAGQLPSIGDGKQLPAEVLEKAMPTPSFAHLKDR